MMFIRIKVCIQFVTLAGLAGFARLCAGDQYEVSFCFLLFFIFILYCLTSLFYEVFEF